MPAALPTPARPIPIRQHLDPVDGRSPFELLAERTPAQRATATDLGHIRMYMEQQAAQGSHASVVLAGFHTSEYFTVADRARYDQLAKANALTVVLAEGLSQRDEPGYHIGGLRPGSAMAGEWVIIVLGPHSAAAFAVRENPTTATDGGPAYDFVYTFQRDAVIDAARRFVQELVDGDQPADPAATPEGSAATARSAQSAPQRRRLDAGGASADQPSLGARPAPVPTALRRSDAGFRAASRIVLDYLNANMPMGVWTITRVANDRQTYLLVDGNDYGSAAGRESPLERLVLRAHGGRDGPAGRPGRGCRAGVRMPPASTISSRSARTPEPRFWNPMVRCSVRSAVSTARAVPS